MNYDIHNNINQREKYHYLSAFISQIQAAAYESYLKIPNFNSYKEYFKRKQTQLFHISKHVHSELRE